MDKFMEKLDIILAAVLLVAFFLPWFSFLGFITVNGMNILDAVQKVHGSIFNPLAKAGFSLPFSVFMPYFLFLIPVFAVLVIVLGLMGRGVKFLSLILGLIPLIEAVYWLIDLRPDLGIVVRVMGIGGWLTLLGGLGLVLFSFAGGRSRRS